MVTAMSKMKQQQAEIVIETIGRRGDGVGTLAGKPVFVPRALPGETVRARLREDREQGIAGQLLEIITPSPQRVAAPCPYYEDCGGCALQHWDGAAYRDWKTGRIAQLLERAGLEPERWLAPVFIPHATRRRASFSALWQNKTLRLGYRRARSHDIIDIPDCMVLAPSVQQMATALRPHLAGLLRPHKAAGIFVQDCGGAVEVMITGLIGAGKEPGLAEREKLAALAQACGVARLSWRADERDPPEVMLEPRKVIKQAGPLAVHLPPGAFLQPSAEGEAALVAAVVSACAAPDGVQRGAVADLFAGCGTFTGPLLEHGPVYAAESDGAAVAALAQAGRAYDLRAEKRNLFAEPLNEKELARFETVVLDPPRMGAKEQAARLARSDVARVVSVSCNPATFIRDAGILSGGGFKLRSIQVVDQFTWSSHIELVGVFGR